MANGATDSNLPGGSRKPPLLSSNSLNGKRVLSYMVLPGIIPEIKNLLKTNFGYLAFLIANIYQMVRILPANHPYTRPENIGRFTIRQVIAVSANHVKLDKNNIDQIVVFGAILTGMVLILAQFISLIFFLLSGTAFAQVPGGLFETPNPQSDIAFFMIREVFGIPEMFGDIERTGMHIGLDLLIGFYNYAILFVAVLVFIYYIITVVGETATTGVPFGQRFSHIYAPFRLVIAIGLLVPLSIQGGAQYYNGAQYIAFYAAKLGSGLATQGWLRFNEVTSETNPLGMEPQLLVAQPNAPDMSGLVESLFLIRACTAAYWTLGDAVLPYILEPNTNRVIGLSPGGADYEYVRDLMWANGEKGHVSLYFGNVEYNSRLSEPEKDPLCGEIKIPIQVDDQGAFDLSGEASPDRMQDIYYRLIHFIYYQEGNFNRFATRLAHEISANRELLDACEIPVHHTVNCEDSYKPSSEFRRFHIDRANLFLDEELQAFFDTVRGQINTTISPAILATGWGGAGIWYNSIAELNGALTTVVVNPPTINKRPRVAEEVLAQKMKKDIAFDDSDVFNPELSGGKEIDLELEESARYVAKVLNEAHKYWRDDRSKSASNFFWDTMIAVFGLNGLYNLRYDDGVDADGNDGRIRSQIHPLAKLSTIGKGLVDSSVENLGRAMGSSFGGGMAGILSAHFSSAAQSAASMFVSIATIGLSVGFILYYILPFLPFMYFFFAVGGWVKGLFEAMVGTPLWALAHLRIDGDGLPGRTAMNGYFLIFEIFLRPILTVFGLIGGLAIFTASATVLNTVFNIAVLNVTGVDIDPNTGGDLYGRAIVDEFFFTVVYAIILYMMAISAFKMITLVPNHILRWIGSSAGSFNDNQEDATAGLTQYAAMGGARIGGQLGQAATQGAGALGEIPGIAGKLANSS